MPSIPRPPPTNKNGNPAVSTSGILSTADGTRIIPSSLRPDGTKRKEIQIRPGYRPPEDVEIYKNRSAQAFKEGGKGGGKGPIPGAEMVSDGEGDAGKGAGDSKNAKKRAAKKKAKAAAEAAAASGEGAGGGEVKKEEKSEKPKQDTPTTISTTSTRIDPENLTPEEKEKQAKGIRKKIRQATDLKAKKDGGENLLPEQMEKVIRIAELTRQLNSLGFDE